MPKQLKKHGVIPAQAGIQFCLGVELAAWNWIPGLRGNDAVDGVGEMTAPSLLNPA